MDLKNIPTMEEYDKMFQDDPIMLMSEIASKQDKKTAYFPTGFSVFDKALKGGVREGDLIIISGKSGMGKTTLAETFTYHFVNKAIPCVWFSFEENITDIWQKFLDMGCEKDFLVYSPLKNTSSRIDWLEFKIKEAYTKFSTKVIFIDHLGFLTPKIEKKFEMGGNMSLNFSVYITQICRQLKTLALELDMVIFLLVHVKKTEGELSLDDLAHSAGIGQEADCVFTIESAEQKRNRLETQDVYSNERIIKTVKNRRTGQNKIIKCQLLNGRLQEITNQYGQ